MELYLIRHTTPDVKKGTCYGQADLAVTESFDEEARCILPHLPGDIKTVYSSPLQRCRKLAERLFPQHYIRFDDRAKEINCGEWELQLWDEIDRTALDGWMADFVNVAPPGGESYQQVYDRVVELLGEVVARKEKAAIVAHGGVLRSIVSYVTQTPLKDSFNSFSIRYGCVIRLHLEGDGLVHTVLHNPESEKEQHKPSYY
jgi:alpha-ribazole phosphatase